VPVSETLKKIRTEKKISQEQLEIRSGISQSGISAIERGERIPTIETLEMLAKGLRVPVTDLIGEEKKPAASEGDRLKQEISILLDELPQEDLSQLREFATFLISRREK
jgi:transcriptional regulator with XRE-family HTH domain